MRKSSARYLEIAERMESDIKNGVYKVGDLLPTEANLCKEYEISRFTARNALSVIEDKGLIQRTQGRGSVVVSMQTSMFKDTWSSIDELLAHADTVQTVLESIDEIVVDPILSSKLGFLCGEKLIQINGLRYQNDGANDYPICTLKIWLPVKYKSAVEDLSQLEGSVAYLLEQRFGKCSSLVDQAVSACIIGYDVANKLKVREGDAALHLLRKFVDDNGEIFEVSESILPTSRFTYNMRLKRS